MTAYVLLEGPSHERHHGSSLLSGFYRAEFARTPDGQRVTRFLTDRGRATMLHRVDRGQHEFSEEELEQMTVAPDIHVLEARYDAEAGEGA
jgi:hypothetical protein